jgi:hypothetical protein
MEKEKGSDAMLPPEADEHIADQLAAEQRLQQAEEQCLADEPSDTEEG